MSSHRNLFSLLPVVVTLAGCAAATPYQAPSLKLAAGYAQTQGAAASPAEAGDWWRSFHDPVLNGLVDQVLTRNNSLAQSAIAARRAQVEAGLAVINPTIAGSGSGQSSQTFGDNSTSASNYQSSATLSYEADLFGRLSAARNVSDFEAKATAEDYATAKLTLVSTTATLYYRLASLNERLSLAESSLAYITRTRDLTDVQRSAGSASGLEAAQTRQSLAQQRASLEELLRQRVAARNAINVLLDGEVWGGTEPTQMSPDLMPGFDAGVPAELLARRPDLRAAELRLRGQLSQVDATRASFYPRLTLNAGANGASQTLGNLLQNPVGTLGLGVALPFLQINQMQLKNRSAQLAYENASIGFRQTLYAAAVEVENALADRRYYAEQMRLSAESLSQAHRVEQLNESLYRAGSINLKFWLDSQEARRQAEVSLSQSILNERLAQITLFKAIGGDA